MACFADTNISQGSVATYARCDGIFNIRLTANLPRNLQVKKFLKSVKIWQNYGHESVAPFFGLPCLFTDRADAGTVSLVVNQDSLLNENVWTTTVKNSQIACSIVLQAMLWVFDCSAIVSICK